MSLHIIPLQVSVVVCVLMGMSLKSSCEGLEYYTNDDVSHKGKILDKHESWKSYINLAWHQTLR